MAPDILLTSLCQLGSIIYQLHHPEIETNRVIEFLTLSFSAPLRLTVEMLNMRIETK